MTTTSSSHHCLSCGELTVVRDRRVLGENVPGVTSLWKDLISEELERRELQLNLADFISPQGVGYLCRKCFHAYDKFLRDKEVDNN